MTAIELIELEQNEKTGILSLSGHGLTEIPIGIAEMTWLKELDLSYNPLTKIQGLEKLKSLTILELIFTQITKIEGLDQLTQLKKLYLSKNQLTKIEGLEKLKQLRVIYLTSNKIETTLGLEHLNHLESLDISSNQLTKIEGIDHLGLDNLNLSHNQLKKIQGIPLSSLRALNLSSNYLTDIDGLKQAKKLKKLGLSYNLLTGIKGQELPISITELYLNGNELTSIESLGYLKSIKILDLSYNKLEKIDGLKQLKQLNMLDLAENDISDISPVQGLSNLTKIVFWSNQISDITQFTFIKNLPKLHIDVHGNPFEQTNNLVFKPNENHYNVLILALEKLEEAKDDGVEGYLPVKILMMGNHGSGKSSLVHYLKHNNLNYNGDTTHILKIEVYKKRANEWPMAYFYDFGGQDFYHGLYQAFLRKGLMTVMLWNEASNENIKAKDKKGKDIRHYNVPYWLGQWKRSIDGTIVLVQSHKDVENSKRISHSGGKYFIDDEFFVSLKKQVGEIDIKSHHTATLQYLKITIDDYISKEQDKQAGKGKISKKYYDFITHIQEQANLLGAKAMKLSDLKPYYKDVDDVRFDTEIDQLVLSGIILKYRDTVWLNAAAVVEKVHEVLSTKLIDKGCISEDKIKEMVGDEDLIGLLKDQKVIFKHEYDQNGMEYIIPNYLPLIESSGVDYDLMVFGLDNPLFILKYEDFMPFGLINNLICHFGQLPDRKKFWRDQLLFTISKKEGDNIIHQAKILIKLNFNDLKLEIYAHFDKECDNESFKNLVKEYIFYSILSFEDPYFFLPTFAEYKAHIPDINCILQNWDENKYRISFCSKNEHNEDECISNIMHDKHLRIENNNIYISLDSKTFIKYRDLLENNNKPTIHTYHENLTFYRELPAYAYQAFTPHKIEKMKKVFISYSKDDLEIVMSFINSMQTLVLQNTVVQPWFCTYLAPGDEVHNKIREKMHEADVVCFMCSNNFFRTQYIIDHELKPTLKRKKEGSQQIILPIIIDRVKWIIDNPEVNLGKFSGFPYRGKPVSSFYNWNDAWYVTNWFLEEVLKKNLENDENLFDKISKLPSDIEELLKSQIKGELNK